MSSISIGETVYVEKYGALATVVSVDHEKNKATLSLKNNLSIKIDLLNIIKIKPLKNKLTISYNGYNSHFLRQKDIFSKFQTEADLHGYRAKEAINYLESLVDLALYYGEDSLIIIHGKGSGILRKVITTFVKDKKNLSFGALPPHFCENSAICIKIN